MRVREEKKLRASHARGGRRHAVPWLRIVHLPTDSLLEEQKKKKKQRPGFARLAISSFQKNGFKYSPEANDASASATSAMRAATFMVF